MANTLTARQEIEIWAQAGASPELLTWPPTTGSTKSLRITGLGPFALPLGSPINIDITVDADGTVRLHAVEPTSGRDVQMNVRISILSEEQVAEANDIAHAGLTVST